MFQENELVNLFTTIAATGILILISRDKKFGAAKMRNFYIGFSLVACAYVATVLEGVIWPDFLNVVEHLSFAVAGLFFALGAWSLAQSSPGDPPDGPS